MSLSFPSAKLIVFSEPTKFFSLFLLFCWIIFCTFAGDETIVADFVCRFCLPEYGAENGPLQSGFQGVAD